MKKLIPLFGSGILAVILGVSNKFVLLGTNSPQMLILTGALLIIIGYISLIRIKIKTTATPIQKKRLEWRIALVVVFSLLTLFGLFLIIGFSVATLIRGKAIFHDMRVATLVGCSMCIPLAPSIYVLKKAQSENKALNIKGND